MIPVTPRRMIVNGDFRTLATRAIPACVEIVTDAQWANPPGEFEPPPELDEFKRRAKARCDALGIGLGMTCNAQFAFLSATEGRFPPQGLAGDQIAPSAIGEPYVYRELTLPDGRILKDVRAPFRLDDELQRRAVANAIALHFRSRRPLMLDGVYNSNICGGLVGWENWCDFLELVCEAVGGRAQDEPRQVWCNIAGTLQSWSPRDIAMLCGTGVRGTIWEQFFIDRPADGAPKQDAENLARLGENIALLRRNGIDVCLLRMPREPRQDDWRDRIAAITGCAVNVVL